jgi:hypothetical protein
MLWGYIFWLLFLTATGYIVRKGSRSQRQAIGIMIFGVLATTIFYAIGRHKWLPLNLAVTMVDIVALFLFWSIAKKSQAFWPLLLTGWQLATVLIHIASLFAQKLLPDAYGTVQGMWAYFQFITILSVTIMERRKAAHLIA